MNCIPITTCNPYSVEYSHFLADQLPRYENFFDSLKCWLLSLSGQTVRIYDEAHNKSFYIRIQDLVRNLCQVKYSKNPGIMLESSAQLSRLALEALNPVLGEKITCDTLRAFFDDFRSCTVLCQLEISTDVETTTQIASNRLEQLKTRHCEILTFGPTLLKNLKPGDILFKKLPHESTNTVVLGQWLLSPFLKGKQDREAYKFSHAMIYLGQRKFAEATPNLGKSEVRIFDLDDPKFVLPPSSSTKYVVARHEDDDIARDAAAIATQIAQNAVNGTGDHSYDYIDALRSIYLSSNFGPLARYRYHKQYYLDRRAESPTEFFGNKDFFCTYFVGYAYQTAESRKVMPQIQEPDDAPIRGPTIFYPLIRFLWGIPRMILNWSAMSKKVKLQFDAKRLTPQDYRNFMVTHPGLFTDHFVIHAQNAART